jgi:hypothetical protein
MFVRQRVETLTHVMELMSFVQDRIRRHWIHKAFPKNLRREKFNQTGLVQGNPEGAFIHGASESIPSLRRRAGTTLR